MATVTPATDLAALAGVRVCIAGFRFATIERINHGLTARHEALHNGVWGLMYEEPRDSYRGCNTAFFFDYGTDIRLAPTDGGHACTQ